ncbi:MULTISPECIES: Hsp70 family protein [Fusobacterium]|uniref:Hsp70 family protein n=1 Tax=Fusobacterium TaxID=848 RepID=UPI0014770894|nr:MULTISPECIES: hypothetical protein [Fusobacterium]NME36545.1 hypothetical protein [Fusobacterium sp. FSA-380-WT-3A]
MRYIGFDLGDGESTVTQISSLSKDIEPIILPIDEKASFISAVALEENEILIGEQAISSGNKNSLRVRFKSKFSEKDITTFSRGVANKIKDFTSGEEVQITVGCPAGWNLEKRKVYQELLKNSGLPNVRVISESRAAFLYAREAKNIRVNPELLKESVLVIDIGSSTLDFAYIVNGKETGIGVFGNNNLGSGIIDEYLLQEAIKNNIHKNKIEEIFEESYGWRCYAQLMARKVKEKYFSNEELYKDSFYEESLSLYYDGVQNLTIKASPEIIRNIINKPIPELDGKSFMEGLQYSLYEAAKVTKDAPPKLLILTGGASRIRFFKEQCKFSFPNSIIVNSEEPEFSIGKGLAYSGIIDERLREFRKEVKEFINSGVIEKNVKIEINDLIYSIVEKLTDYVINNAVLPNISLWKKGKIDTIQDMNEILSNQIKSTLSPEQIKLLLEDIIIKWSFKLCHNLQSSIDDICNKYLIPKEEMRLVSIDTNTNFNNLSFSIKNLQGENIINGIVSLIVGVLIGSICGGSGTALIATGPLGFIGGALLGIIITSIGFNKSKNLFMTKSIPILARKLVRKDMLLSEKNKEKLANSIAQELQNTDNNFIENLSKNISNELNLKLEKLAQDVEILIF